VPLRGFDEIKNLLSAGTGLRDGYRFIFFRVSPGFSGLADMQMIA
jgi:hypothetical protein